MSTAFSGLTGWALFAGLVLTTGAVASRWFILRVPGSEDGRLRADSARLGSAGAAVLTLALGLFFVRQLLEFRDPFSPWTEEASLLMGTPWGRTWVLTFIASVFVFLTFRLAARRPFAWWLVTPLVLGLGAFPALTGHAAAEERWTVLFVLGDTLHVWAAGAWIGGLAVVLWLERTERRDTPDGTLLPALVPAFSPVAVGAVATLVVTGGLASWAHLPSVGALFTSGYGRLLLIKLLCVAGVLALGARNARVLTPRLGTDEGNDAMRRSAVLELVVAQGVLIVTALLVRTSPMGG